MRDVIAWARCPHHGIWCKDSGCCCADVHWKPWRFPGGMRAWASQVRSMRRVRR